MIGLAEATMRIAAPKERVFDLFTTEAGLGSWMGNDVSVDLRPGGAWRWVHDNGVASSGEYIDVEPHDRLSFTYGWESGPYADMAPGSTVVEVTFVDHDGATDVTVRHDVVPQVHRDAHAAGWNYFLGLLADLVADRALPTTRLPQTGA